MLRGSVRALVAGGKLREGISSCNLKENPNQSTKKKKKPKINPQKVTG